MLTLVRDAVRWINMDLKAHDASQRIASILRYAEQVVRLRQEQTVHAMAAIFLVYLIVGWNLYFIGSVIGFLLSVHALLLAIDSSLTIDETKWLFYWLIYVLCGFLEYLCSHVSLLLRIFHCGKCLLLLWLTLPELMQDHLTVCYKSAHQWFSEDSQVDPSPTITESRESDYRLLIGQFYHSGDMKAPIEALQTKGFRVDNVKTEAEFVRELQSHRYQLAWVISSSSIETGSFVPALLDFHAAGGAIFLFADNVPYVAHASAFLDAKFHITLTGNYPGSRILTRNHHGHSRAGHFVPHEMFTGIDTLFEGVTICHPVSATARSEPSMTTLATATSGQPCITAFDPPPGSSEGRLCLDCGFTKLFINWDSPGTPQFIVNASCWLAKATERRSI